MMLRWNLMAGLLGFTLITGCTSKAERAFMMGCVSHESMKAQCECVYDELKDHYPKSVFNNMEQGYVPPDFVEQTAAAALRCQD